jgi:hypothetical protein
VLARNVASPNETRGVAGALAAGQSILIGERPGATNKGSKQGI